MNLDKTLEIYHIILGEYTKLNDESILVVDYTGFARDYSLYKILEWYISFNNSQSKYSFDNRYFNHNRLIEMLTNSNIDFIDNHISSETINEQFHKANFTSNYSFKREFETISKLYVANNVREKIKTRKLN